MDDRDELRDEDDATGEFTIAMETCWALGGTAKGTMGTMCKGWLTSGEGLLLWGCLEDG